MCALPELVGGETITVGGEGLDDVLEGVGGGEPVFGVEILLYHCDLGVKGFGDEDVGAGREVLEKALELTHEMTIVSRGGAGDYESPGVMSHTVVRNTPAVVETRERVQIRSGISIACFD